MFFVGYFPPNTPRRIERPGNRVEQGCVTKGTAPNARIW
jgi:hypothetical protein